jgi:hypothetical protein
MYHPVSDGLQATPGGRLSKNPLQRAQRSLKGVIAVCVNLLLKRLLRDPPRHRQRAAGFQPLDDARQGGPAHPGVLNRIQGKFKR